MDKKKLPTGITQLKDNSYKGTFMYHGIRKAVYAKTVSECVEKLDALKHDMRAGNATEATKTTLNDYAVTFIAYKAKQAKTDTITAYKRQLDLYVLPTFGKYRLADIRKDMIREWIADIANDKATSTVKLIWSVCSAVFAQAFSDDLITKNPCDGIIVPKGKAKKETETFETKAQVELFCANLPNDVYGKLMRFTMLTGLRAGEIRALKWSDISLSKREMHVQRTMLNNGDLDTTKTDAGNRIVPLNDEALSILYGLRNDNDIISLDGFVFCDNNEPTTIGKLTAAIDRITKKCGSNFPHITMHSLRHYFATTCANNGMTPKVLMSIMGHSNIAITMNLYAHANNESNKAEMNNVASCF